MGSGTRWNHRETIALIRLWRTDRVQQLMDGSTRNARAYEILSEDLRKLGFLRSSSQVKERMKRLKREYRQIILQASQQGLNPANWPYYHLVRPIVEQAFSFGPRTSIEAAEDPPPPDDSLGIPYVISKPDISAYEIEESPSPSNSQHGSLDGMDATSGELEYHITPDMNHFHSAFHPDAQDRVPHDMLPLQDGTVEIAEQDASEALDVKPHMLMDASSSSAKAGGATKKKFKKNFMKEIFETVKAAQMEACTKLTETFQELEEKRMQLEVELEERRQAAEKEMLQAVLTSMQSSMNQMVKSLRKPCCHSCHCNSKSDDDE